MNDPYSILGVSQSATDDEVKKAYRELARKYHPDNYHDNPLADLAQEKMKEINEAYDTITKSRQNGGGSYSGSRGYSSGAGSTGYKSSSPEFARVRQAINAGNLDLAEQLLNGAPVRNAEWNFLMGSLCYRRGWLDDAQRYYQTAASMEPTNVEYQQALQFMNRGGQPYRPYGGGVPANGDCDFCDFCTAMMCMNMCCNCR